MTRRRKLHLPDWWAWELLLSDHVERRMDDRRFTEVDLRAMLQGPRGVRPAQVEGRFLVDCTHGGVPWVVVVEPQPTERTVIVVTAYAPA